MRVLEIIWTPEIEEKVQSKHGLALREVEETCLDPAAHIRKARCGRYALLGRTQAGRYVFVVYRHLGQGKILIITARDMTDSERNLYERHSA